MLVDEKVAQLVSDGRWEDVVALLSREPDAVARSAQLTSWLAVGLLTLKRVEEAVLHFREAVEREPGNPWLQAGLGLALVVGGQGREAEALARDALLTHDTVLLRSVLGMALRIQGQAAEASGVYREGVAEHPGSADMLRVVADALSDALQPDEARAFYDFADRSEGPQ